MRHRVRGDLITIRAAAVLAAAALFMAAAGPAGAQTACQQIQITTSRTSTPIAVTPLDAIAFPVTLSPAVSLVTRVITVCPPGAFPPAAVPVLTPVPVIGAPVIGTPVLEVPLAAPILIGSDTTVTLAPGAAHVPTASPPTVPLITGAVPADTVAALATQAERFDRTVVTVAGTAAAVARTADEHGAPLTAFRLEADGRTIGVVVWGRVPVRPGDHVRVSGPFYVSTPFADSSGTPWHNVVEADLLER